MSILGPDVELHPAIIPAMAIHTGNSMFRKLVMIRILGVQIIQVMILLTASQGLLTFKGVGRVHPGGTIGMDGGNHDRDKNSDKS